MRILRRLSVIKRVAGSGIPRSTPPEFAWHLSTFRVHNPSRNGELGTFDSPGLLFPGERWEVFDPRRRQCPSATRRPGTGG